jgi:hypothetical protein
MKRNFLVVLILSLSIYYCTSNTSEKVDGKTKSQNIITNLHEEIYESSSSKYSDEEGNYEDANDVVDNSSECKFEDGTYSATVDYINPSTGYSQTYSLDVEVVDCQVVQIDFPNGGWLDESHISAADIDENGDASVDGEEGKTYQVHIDN